jgi:hypothetical protein
MSVLSSVWWWWWWGGAAEVVGDRVAVDSGAEVAVGVGEVVVGTDVVGGGASAGPEPSKLLVLLAGGGRTWRYRASTATKSRDSSSVAGNRRAITRHRGPARWSGLLG